MRFAVISDVQANLSALQAVLAALDSQHEVDRVIAAGDLVGRGPYPNEVVALLQERDVEAVRGNYDDAVAFDRLGSGVDLPDLAAEAADQRALDWTRRTLAQANLDYLRQLPRDVRLFPAFSGVRVRRNTDDDRTSEYRRSFFARALFGGMYRQPKASGKRVRILHGSPRALNEAIRPDTANSILATIARDAEADVLIAGHAGVSFQRLAEGTTFIGVGSVSGPHIPLGQAEFAVVTVGEQVEVEFGRASYDPAEHLEAIHHHGLPAEVTAPDTLRLL